MSRSNGFFLGFVASRTVLTAMVLLAVSLGGAAVQAAPIALTPAGVAQGFTLTTFATGFPNTNNVGPLGIAFTSNGGVLVSDKLGNVRLFPTDIDGQVAAAAPVGQNYGLDKATGLTQVGNTIYMTRQSTGDVVQINQNGTLNQVIISGLPFITGIAANPTNGHLFVSTLGMSAIYDIDPIAKTKTLFTSGDVDGVSFSSDGSTLYAVRQSDNHVIGYNVAAKAVIFDSGFIPGVIDGTAAGTGQLAGNLFVNTNGGTIVEVNLASHVQTTIADMGSRGDFVTVDFTNGTLLLTQTDRIVRLSLNGGGFSAVPLPPGIWAGAFTALGGVVISRRATKKRAQQSAK
ncbi:MAG: hypothetical protein JWN40_4232 [Phycisphaerales bacterium]|nr:hypothetical protein [Phycisphaerales bacterium]